MSKERVAEWDVLRGIAFLAIVLQHSIGQFATRKDASLWDAYTLAGVYHFVKFGVPAFVLLTGAALVYNYYGKLNYPAFIKKRSIDILIPYFLWTAIYYVYMYPKERIHFHWFKEVGRQIIAPTLGYHFWFILMIFQFYLLFPLFLKGLTWAKERRGLLETRTLDPLLVVTGLGYMLLMWASYKYLPNHSSSYPDLLQYFITNRNTNFLFYSFYFIFGALIAMELDRWRKNIKGSLRWNAILFIVAYGWVGYELFAGSGYSLPINLDWSTTLKPSMFVLVFSELIALYMIAMKVTKKNNWVNKLTSWLGKYSLGAYLAHALVLGELVKLIDAYHKVYPALNQHYVLVTFLAFLIVSVVSTLTCYMISKIPFGRYLIGPTGSKKKLM
ncbi:MAG TPA: acyltransferase [Desulfosporosinus sp.]|nr:acyltransferase [Desulfosporosinus sp.]